MNTNYIVDGDIEICVAFECNCRNKGNCDTCELMNMYIDYCNNFEESKQN